MLLGSQLVSDAGRQLADCSGLAVLSSSVGLMGVVRYGLMMETRGSRLMRIRVPTDKDHENVISRFSGCTQVHN